MTCDKPLRSASSGWEGLWKVPGSSPNGGKHLTIKKKKKKEKRITCDKYTPKTFDAFDSSDSRRTFWFEGDLLVKALTKSHFEQGY